MSTLVLMLTAAMAVPGNGPEMESGEVEQGLDLRGEWEGIIPSRIPARIKRIELIGDQFRQYIADKYVPSHIVFTDEGTGRLRVRRKNDDYLGIYRWEGDHIFICVRHAPRGRPTEFKQGEDRFLFILHRVKPRK